jgi:DNA (cytosine-5)-methyltransferase 1
MSVRKKKKQLQPTKRRVDKKSTGSALCEDPAPYNTGPHGHHERHLKTLDLFCGAGGLAEGFRMAGYTSIGGVDNDPDAIATFSANFPLAKAICGDIRNSGIREQVLELARRADMVIGGPPCQGFSQVRNHSRLIEDPKNSLYREFVHILSEAEPAAFLMENVTGMDQMGVRKQIAEDLSLGGHYRVSSQVVDAADYGVPQSRKRLLFLGIKASLNIEPPLLQGTGVTAAMALARRNGKLPIRYELEAIDTLWASSLTSILEDPADTRIVTVAQAISDLRNLKVGGKEDIISYHDLPPPESAYQAWIRSTNNECLLNIKVPRINHDTELRLKNIPQGGNHRDLPEQLLKRHISGQKWGQHNGSGMLSRRHFYAYRKLHPSVWAWTLNTKADSAYHYSSPRALSVREFARIQSFPDKFIVTTDPRRGLLPGRMDGGAAHSKYRQMGNAVPPLLAKAAAEAFKKLLVSALARTKATAA